MSTKRTIKDPTRRIPKRDPEAAYVRKTVAKRRIGDRRCLCGERKAEALNYETVWCFACQRQRQGRSTVDEHHYAGEANDPTTTFPVPVDQHQELTSAQLDWPKETRENPRGSPALAAAGRVRG